MTPIPGEGDASHVSETVRPASSAGVATNIRRAESSSPTGTTQGREDVAGLKQKVTTILHFHLHNLTNPRSATLRLKSVRKKKQKRI